MTFATFALPILAPRRWELLALAVVVSLALGVDALDAGAATLVRILGVVPAVVVGATMATRACGAVPTWGGLAGGVVVAALTPPVAWAVHDGITAALFAALGMGAAAWRRLRIEVTYARRIDLVAGFATVALVLLALGLSWAGSRLTWQNGAAFAVGAVVLLFAPRRWEPPVSAGTGSPARGPRWGRSGP